MHHTENHHRWLKMLPNNLANSFEVRDDETFELNRMTGLVYKPSLEFVERVNNLLGHKKEATLCWVMALDDTHRFRPYFELSIDDGSENIRLVAKDVLTRVVYQPTFAFAHEHQGVTPNYRNEICLNWGALPYANFADIFYAPVQYGNLSQIGKKHTVLLEGPKRLRKCVIPFSDFAVLTQEVILNPNAHIIVHLGVSNLSSGQFGVPFNPIIEVMSSSKEPIANTASDFNDSYLDMKDDEETQSTDLDFVFYCPPNCPG